jgi:hypothetical protein
MIVVALGTALLIMGPLGLDFAERMLAQSCEADRLPR